jgi:peptide deformylase
MRAALHVPLLQITRARGHYHRLPSDPFICNISLRASSSGATALPAPAVRQVVVHPHTILRQKAIPISAPYSPDVLQLLADLRASCREHQGLGLAAPQVGVGLRAFVMQRPTIRWSRARRSSSLRGLDTHVVCVNPRIISKAGPLVVGMEACLSVPGRTFLVGRQRALTVAFMDEHSGGETTVDIDGLPAVVFQHELDHLDGVLVTDVGMDENDASADDRLRAAAQWERDIDTY